jgi:hypothetical protein
MTLHTSEFHDVYVSSDTVRVIKSGSGMGGLGFEPRWGGGRFSAPAQACPEAYPASCTIGTRAISQDRAAGEWC